MPASALYTPSLSIWTQTPPPFGTVSPALATFRGSVELNPFDLSFLTPSSYSRSARVSFDLGLPLGDYAFPARRPSTDLCDAFGSRKRSIGLLGSPWRRTSSIDMGDPFSSPSSKRLRVGSYSSSSLSLYTPTHSSSPYDALSPLELAPATPTDSFAPLPLPWIDGRDERSFSPSSLLGSKALYIDPAATQDEFSSVHPYRSIFERNLSTCSNSVFLSGLAGFAHNADEYTYRRESIVAPLLPTTPKMQYPLLFATLPTPPHTATRSTHSLLPSDGEEQYVVDCRDIGLYDRAGTLPSPISPVRVIKTEIEPIPDVTFERSTISPLQISSPLAPTVLSPPSQLLSPISLKPTPSHKSASRTSKSKSKSKSKTKAAPKSKRLSKKAQLELQREAEAEAAWEAENDLDQDLDDEDFEDDDTPSPAPLPAASSSSSAAKKKRVKLSTEDARRRDFLERNRIAACKSRQKKKEKVGGLESKAFELAESAAALQKTALELRAEVAHLRYQLDLHAACLGEGAIAPHIEGYLARERQGGGIPVIDLLAGRVLSLEYAKVPRLGESDDCYRGLVAEPEWEGMYDDDQYEEEEEEQHVPFPPRLPTVLVSSPTASSVLSSLAPTPVLSPVHSPTYPCTPPTQIMRRDEIEFVHVTREVPSVFSTVLPYEPDHEKRPRRKPRARVPPSAPVSTRRASLRLSLSLPV